MEYIDIYDENRNLTGERLPRKTKLTKGQYMLYVLALIENAEHKLLVTKRAMTKKWAAGEWEIPGGGVHEGETSLDAVCRETLEETGLELCKEQAKVIYSYCNEDLESGDNYFMDIYLCSADFTLKDVAVQEEEVMEARLVTLEEIKELKARDGFLHYKRICQALQIEE